MAKLSAKVAGDSGITVSLVGARETRRPEIWMVSSLRVVLIVSILEAVLVVLILETVLVVPILEAILVVSILACSSTLRETVSCTVIGFATIVAGSRERGSLVRRASSASWVVLPLIGVSTLIGRAGTDHVSEFVTEAAERGFARGSSMSFFIATLTGFCPLVRRRCLRCFLFRGRSRGH